MASWTRQPKDPGGRRWSLQKFWKEPVNSGEASCHERWGIHLCSGNGTDGWQKYAPLVVYNHEIQLTNDSILHLLRRERPQLLIENHEITHLVTSVYDGKDSWSQPVKLKQPVRVE